MSEYAANAVSDWPKLIRSTDITWIGVEGKRKGIILQFRQDKTNKEGIYPGTVEAVCSCESGLCPVHVIERYLKIRDNVWDNVKDSPLLIGSNGKPMRQQHVNNLIKNLAEKAGLEPLLYSSHSLRSGRATDLARALKPTWFIKKWGRWRTDCWQAYYAKLDFRDIAKMSNLTLSELGLAGNALTFNQLKK